MRILIAIIAVIISLHSFAGELYDQLSGQSPKKVVFALFDKENFGASDVADLDKLWLEYNFSENDIVKYFDEYQKKNNKNIYSYQEVILWHTNEDLIPASTSDEDFRQVAALFHEKSSLFHGSVRLIGGFLDNDKEYRHGICRWTAPNTFLMLYVVKLARAPYLGDYFPKDGGSMLYQTLH
jgi:hypothetical protein